MIHLELLDNVYLFNRPVSGERLVKCPLCTSPSRVSLTNSAPALKDETAECSSPKCQFLFCPKCQCKDHPGKILSRYHKIDDMTFVSQVVLACPRVQSRVKARVESQAKSLKQDYADCKVLRHFFSTVTISDQESTKFYKYNIYYILPQPLSRE